MAFGPSFIVAVDASRDFRRFSFSSITVNPRRTITSTRAAPTESKRTQVVHTIIIVVTSTNIGIDSK